jgi:DNA-directed RNA polymerase specialized sigma24 family protein
MKTWDELTDKERYDYINQDVVNRDPRLVYVPTNYLDNMMTNVYWADVILNQDDWDFVQQAGLTNRQKDCLYKNKWENKTQTDIAKELNIPQQTVSFHIQQAFKKILKLIKRGVEDQEGTEEHNGS